MARKTKILITVACILLGAAVMVFWPEEDNAAVWIIFDGVSVSDTNRVAFTLTNAHNKILRYDYDVRIPQRTGLHPENWMKVSTNNARTNLIIAKHSAVHCYATVPSTNRWRIALTQKTAGKAHAELSRPRQMLWKWAQEHDWTRFRRWVWSGETFVTLYGPEMLGNQPVLQAAP
jgi:hypothetical protein